MTLDNHHFSKGKYIFIHGGFSIDHVSFGGYELIKSYNVEIGDLLIRWMEEWTRCTNASGMFKKTSELNLLRLFWQFCLKVTICWDGDVW